MIVVAGRRWRWCCCASCCCCGRSDRRDGRHAYVLARRETLTVDIGVERAYGLRGDAVSSRDARTRVAWTHVVVVLTRRVCCHRRWSGGGRGSEWSRL